jgi:hypothetical protein
MQPSYQYLKDFTEEDVEYFRQMPFSLSIPSHGVLVVHAGIVPGVPLEQQKLNDLITVRTIYLPGILALLICPGTWSLDVICPGIAEIEAAFCARKAATRKHVCSSILHALEKATNVEGVCCCSSL